MRNLSEYYRPKTIEEALALLARGAAIAPIGGGSALLAEGRRDVEAVVDLQDLELSYVRREGEALRIGATTTLQTLIDAPDAAQAWDGELARVATLSAARNLREQGTLAGALVSAEGIHPLAVLLLALDTTLAIEPGRKTVSLEEFLEKRASLITASLITEAIIPLPAIGGTQRAAFEKVSRTPADLPIVCAAVRARIEQGVARDVRIALGGVAARPYRAARLEQAVAGQPLDAAAVDLSIEPLEPPSDFLGSAEYRREMAAVLTRRAVRRLSHS